MDLILCHTTADFDTLGAAVGLTLLLPGSKIVLPGGAHPTVQDFLALYRDEYRTIERRAVNPAQIRSLHIVDTQQRDRLGKAAEWLDLADLAAIVVYDHHHQTTDIPATQVSIEPVGASTTIIVEKLQQAQIVLTTAEATVMALGIHVDTGSLTFEMSTARDALALGWLMQQGANLSVISDYIAPGLSPQLQQLLQTALAAIESVSIRGETIAWVKLKTDRFVPGLSSLATQIRSLMEIDALLLFHEYPTSEGELRLTIVGRSQIPSVDLHDLFQPLGGGGHARAASVNMRGVDSGEILRQLLERIQTALPQPLSARDVMSTPIRTIRPNITIADAQRILLRYGHSGLPVVDERDNLIGIISRRDLDIALHHGFSHAPVTGYMTTSVKTITPDTPLSQIEATMVTYDLGRLPVLAEDRLVGIVTRTDVLRELHQQRSQSTAPGNPPQSSAAVSNLNLQQLEAKLAPKLWSLLRQAARAAAQRGWQLYLVGGAVRDLLLAADRDNLLIKDIDLVVDGFDRAADVGAGVELATALQQLYPAARLDVHGAFQTAALLWHKDPEFDSLWVDIATARTEFYPYPAANPEVESSSIRQDLYRRDFTINALALRLTPDRSMIGNNSATLLDFFGGLEDLQTKQIRVLHPNSFIEDPTRIYRGVRFAIRLGFQLELQTEAYIRYAITSGVYDRTVQENQKTPALQTRLKTELKHLLQAAYWQPALELLDNLGALQCIHATLKLDRDLLQQLRLLERCLRRFDPHQHIVHWQLRLEALLAALAPAYRPQVAKNLQLPADSITRLQNLAAAESSVIELVPTFERPSQVVGLLKQYDRATLILIAVRCRHNSIVRRQVWRYLTVWTNIQPPLTGDDLRQLGYKPGPQYRQILDALTIATLDGKIVDRAAAEVFVCHHAIKMAE